MLLIANNLMHNRPHTDVKRLTVTVRKSWRHPTIDETENGLGLSPKHRIPTLTAFTTLVSTQHDTQSIDL